MPAVQKYAGGGLEDRLFLFSDFKNLSGAVLDPTKVRTITINSMVNAATSSNTFYFDRISLYKSDALESWITMRTSHPSNNLFERGETVELKLTTVGNLSSETKILLVVIKDYWKKEVLRKFFPVQANATEYNVACSGLAPGFYEVACYWASADGQALSERSCLQMPGSMISGMATFAIMPSTLQENRERLMALDVTNRSFGFHGDAQGLADYMGMSWHSEYWHWSWKEPTSKSIRTEGTSQWARDMIATVVPAPSHWLNIMNLAANNIGLIPTWAQSENKNQVPSFKDWEDWNDYLRDTVKVMKSKYPHQQHRIYDVAWEVNLNFPPVSATKPIFTVDDLVELYRRSSQVIKQEDPEAILAGPCANSVIQFLPWYQKLFEAGILKYVDAINTHLYLAPPPETAQIPERLKDFHSLIRQYNNGKDLLVYGTEVGYQSMVGSDDQIWEQAKLHVRSAILYKGEGVAVYYPFYGYDFHSEDTGWGVCFNLNPKKEFGPKEISPKPAVPALATCVKLLEGSQPVQSLHFLDRDVWGYVFNKQGVPVLALWAPFFNKRLVLPVGEVSSVKKTTMVGSEQSLSVENGTVALDLDSSPIYIEGASAEIYLNVATNFVACFSGAKKQLTIPSGATLTSSKAFGRVMLSRSVDTSTDVEVVLPSGVAVNPSAVILGVKNPDGSQASLVTWLVAGELLQCQNIVPTLSKKGYGCRVDLKNDSAVDTPVELFFKDNDQWKKGGEGLVKGNALASIEIPLELSSSEIARCSKKLTLKIKSGTAYEVSMSKTLAFLAAKKTGGSGGDSLFPNTASIKGPGSSGAIDRADLEFQWDEKYLTVLIRSYDDVFFQNNSDANIWSHDSVQLAFDTDPESEHPYYALAGLLSKKITELCFAQTPAGLKVWRYLTHNEKELATGDVTTMFPLTTITRDETSKQTFYKVVLPWKELGIDGQVQAGRELGISALINDRDGVGTPRTGLEFFSGILKGKDWKLFGRILLQP
jgi:hypothetical protein